MFFSALSFFQNHMQHLFWSVLLLLTVLGKGSCMLQEAEITVFCTQSDCGQFIWALNFSLPLEYRMTSEEDCFLFAYLMSCNITLEFRLFCIWTEPYFFFFFFFWGETILWRNQNLRYKLFCRERVKGFGLSLLWFFSLSLQLTFSRTFPNFLAASMFSWFIMRWVNIAEGDYPNSCMLINSILFNNKKRPIFTFSFVMKSWMPVGR